MRRGPRHRHTAVEITHVCPEPVEGENVASISTAYEHMQKGIIYKEYNWFKSGVSNSETHFAKGTCIKKVELGDNFVQIHQPLNV